MEVPCKMEVCAFCVGFDECHRVLCVAEAHVCCMEIPWNAEAAVCVVDVGECCMLVPCCGKVYAFLAEVGECHMVDPSSYEVSVFLVAVDGYYTLVPCCKTVSAFVVEAGGCRMVVPCSCEVCAFCVGIGVGRVGVDVGRMVIQCCAEDDEYFLDVVVCYNVMHEVKTDI